jgi:photosystem II stability/assembly factor-like uncharacterized protein
MRGSNGELIGGARFGLLGMDGGGWVTGIDIADDGTTVTRNDTYGAHVRGPGDNVWTGLFSIGKTYREQDFVFKNPAGLCYEVCIAPTNSNVIYACAKGFLWKSVDRGASMTRLAGYKRGDIDTSMSFGAVDSARLAGQHMRVDPAGSDVVAFGHPVDGLYYTVDGGERWARHRDIPAPTTPIGISLVFDRSSPIVNGQTQTVYVVVAGKGTYRSTNGIGGHFTRMADGPMVASALAAGGGNLYIVGNGVEADTQLFVWTGSAWMQPPGIAGMGVAVRPSVPRTVIVMTAGGGMFASSDAGANWTDQNISWSLFAEDVPWLGWTKSDYFALGSVVFHPTLNRLVATNGIGVFYLDNPPLARPAPKQRWVSQTKGIQQLIPMEIAAAPNGRVHAVVMDRVIFSFDRDRCSVQASRHGPDNLVILRQGCSVDFAANDPDYLVVVYQGEGSISQSSDGGRSWKPMPSVPRFTHSTEGSLALRGGSVAVSNAGNIVWVSTVNGGIRSTRDGGESWVKPSFGGNDMADAYWHNVYYLRRRVVVADKARPGTFYAFCVGTGKGDAKDRAMLGLWKSTDGGVNFSRIRDTLFTTFPVDFWHGKLKLVPGKADHLVWCAGAQGNYPTPPAEYGIYFSIDEGVTTRQLPGWQEPDDIAFGKAASGAAYPAIYVVGWRDGVHGLWRCIDFNPANLKGTWHNLGRWPMGRDDTNICLAADLTRFGRVYYGFSGGSVAYADYDYTMRLS